MLNPTNKLPKIDIRNPKNLIVKALTEKFVTLGQLTVPVDVVKEYPSKETFKTDRDGVVMPARKVVVRKTDNRIKMDGIGQEYGSSFFNPDSLDLRFKLGWEDAYEIEISVWSPDSDDRDNLVELIKLWMLEFQQSELEEGGFFFYNHGIHSVSFNSARDGMNKNVYQNGPMYIGYLNYSLLAEFSGTTIHEHERYGFLLNAVLNPNIGGDTATQPSAPIIIDVGNKPSSLTGCIDCDCDNT